jgi:hypothetical protein
LDAKSRIKLSQECQRGKIRKGERRRGKGERRSEKGGRWQVNGPLAAESLTLMAKVETGFLRAKRALKIPVS